VLNQLTHRLLIDPLGFLAIVFRGFVANQGFILAGAIAYYALLSLVPLLILSVILLSNFIDQAILINTLVRYLEWLVPSQSAALINDISRFLESSAAIGIGLFLTLIFFSATGFSVVQNAMGVIFKHRQQERRRTALLAACLPYIFVLLLVLLLLFVTALTIIVESLAIEQIRLGDLSWSLREFSGSALYLVGFAVEAFCFAAIYMVMPAGKTRLMHASLGGLTAALLWEAARHSLAWYFSSLSQASVVYGSLSTAVIVLLSMEIAAIILLLGAQVISEYEKSAQKQDQAMILTPPST
jgi:membrane protein